MSHLGAGIIFTDGNYVLMLRRSKNTEHGGSWAIPGGHAWKKELPIETAKRETKEECGRTNLGKQFKEVKGNFYIYFYKTDRFSCKLNDEHDQWKWVPVSDVKKLKLHPKFGKHWNSYLRVIRDKFKVRSFGEWLSSLA